MAAPGSGSDLLLKLNEVVSRIEGTKRKLEDEEAAFHNFMASHQKRVRKLQSEKAYLEQQQAQLVAELQSSGGAALAAATAAPFHAGEALPCLPTSSGGDSKGVPRDATYVNARCTTTNT